MEVEKYTKPDLLKAKLQCAELQLCCYENYPPRMTSTPTEGAAPP
jgi:hypothetical protein